MARQLYELCGSDPARVFSPYCWRARLALAHKGLDFESVPWRFTETERLAFANHKTVPVLVDGERAIGDSWAIAEHLDATYQDAPSLMRGNAEPYRFLAAWTDAVLHAGLVRLIVSDIPPWLGDMERPYFLASREKRFGMPLAEVTKDREARLPAFRESLLPLRLALRGRAFLGGAAPDYADHIVMGGLMWARSVSPLRVLAPEDPLTAWRDSMLDQYGGMARQAPSAES